MIRSIISLAGIAGAVALFFLYTKPAYDEVQSLKVVNDSYDAALDKAGELQRLKQSLLSRYNAFDPVSIDRLNKMLPDHVDNVSLVLELDSLAAQHGLALQSYEFSYPTGTETATGRTVIGPARDQYDSVLVNFSTAADYPSFVAFLTDLQNSLRIADPIGVSFTPASSVPGTEPTYRFDITLRTYWLK